MSTTIKVGRFTFESVGPCFRCDEIEGIADRVFDDHVMRPWRAKIAGAYIMNVSGKKPRTYVTAHQAVRAIVTRASPQKTGKKPVNPPTPEELAAIDAVKAIRPRWRQAINQLWVGESSFRPGELTADQQAVLRHMRNGRGPSWLANLR